MNNFRYKLISPKIIEKVPTIEKINKNDVVVKPLYLSICAADQRYYFGNRSVEILKQKLPLCLIHEAIGIVTYSTSDKFKVNDKVILYPNINVKHVKNENYNKKAKFMSSSVDGFMQESIVINQSNLIKIDPTFNEFYLLVMCELLSIIVHTIESNKAIFKKAKSIALFGDGNLSYLGHLYLLYNYPNKQVYVYGKNTNKLNYFCECAKCINILKEDHINYDFDVGIEMVGGNNAEVVIDTMINNINSAGTIFLLGVSENKIPINTRLILEKGLTLIGRSRSQKSDFIKASEFIYNHPNEIKQVFSEIIEVKSIDDIQDAFHKSENNIFKTIMKWGL